jgi:hypothetical protein
MPSLSLTFEQRLSFRRGQEREDGLADAPKDSCGDALPTFVPR